MRTFIAIEINDSIKSELAKIQSHLKYAGADVKWVTPENIHLTLKFLGDITDESVKKISFILDKIAKENTPFNIEVNELGVFPNIEFPRVVWMGVGSGADKIQKIFTELDDQLEGLGFQKETRPFTSHLTIGRVRSPKNKLALAEKIRSVNFPPSVINRQHVSSIILNQSTLTPTGSIYTKLHEASFA